jgi:hypothetical protein
VRSSLENLLQRSNFEDLCEKWRSFERKEGVSTTPSKMR